MLLFSHQQKELVNNVFKGDNEMNRKYLVLKNNNFIVNNKRAYHCPSIDCPGIVNPAAHATFAKVVSCNYCEKKVCSSCQQLMGENHKCEFSKQKDPGF
jgi:hypothetical protein